MPVRNPVGIFLWGVLIAALLFTGWLAYSHLLQRGPTLYADKKAEEMSGAELAEYFKYGAIGNQNYEFFPFKIWAVLPNVCPNLIGENYKDGYKNFGFLYEKDESGKDKDIPVGMSKTRIGFERVAINCAICHQQTFKFSQHGPIQSYIGGSANRLDSQRYVRFISDCAATENFTPEKILTEMKKRFTLNPFEELLYRYAIIPLTKSEIQTRITKRFAWTYKHPLWGPGRVSPFNPVKFAYLKQPIDDTVDHADVMPAWNADEKEKLSKSLHPDQRVYWHWDGLSSDLDEVILNSALGDGTVAKDYDPAMIAKIKRFLYDLQSPKLKDTASAAGYDANFDPALLQEGKVLFDGYCAECHGNKGERTMTLIPDEEIGTDPNRLRMWTEEAKDAYNNYDKDGQGKDVEGTPMTWTFNHFENIEAYITQPLDGIWLTAPYLHNGSVPTLYDLLLPEPERPKAFIRGLDLIDLRKGGYSAPACDPQIYKGEGFCFDTRLRGNGNQGHDYGTALTESERRALVHYLLSL